MATQAQYDIRATVDELAKRMVIAEEAECRVEEKLEHLCDIRDAGRITQQRLDQAIGDAFSRCHEQLVVDGFTEV